MSLPPRSKTPPGVLVRALVSLGAIVAIVAALVAYVRDPAAPGPGLGPEVSAPPPPSAPNPGPRPGPGAAGARTDAGGAATVATGGPGGRGARASTAGGRLGGG